MEDLWFSGKSGFCTRLEENLWNIFVDMCLRVNYIAMRSNYYEVIKVSSLIGIFHES